MTDDIIKLPNYFATIAKTLEERTPPEKIKKRPGPGGITLDYVEIGYVLKQLDKAFNHLWDFEILEEEVRKDQVWVKVKLTIHLAPSFDLKKEAFGSSDIKRYSSGPNEGKVIDIANDLKSASADALKKAASLLGIAADVYYPREFVK